MKILTMTTAILALTTAAAFADGPHCEREHTLYRDGQLVDTSQLVFYAHGCDRYQYSPLSAVQVRTLMAADHCSIESSTGGGGCEPGYEEAPGGECIRVVPVEREVVETELEVDEIVEIREREVPVEYEVADGSIHERDNLTSMGANSQGNQVLRVRSATDNNPVTIRRAGSGEVWSGTVGRGDTLIEVGPSGTYIAQTGSRSITKATGPQSFNDTRVEEYRFVELVPRIISTTRIVQDTETRIGERLPDNERNRQPGPRTERCGFPGEAIPPLN